MAIPRRKARGVGFGRRGSLSWETATSSFFDAVRLRSIKSKITVFAVVATLIPTVTMGWLSFRNYQQVIDDNIARELGGLTSGAVAQLDRWLKERKSEVGVLADSHEVSENLRRIGVPETSARDVAASEIRLRDYLGSVGKKFPDYRELAVMGTDGKVVVGSTDRPGALTLPADWLNRVRSEQTMIGDADFDHGTLVIADAIRAVDQTFLGALCAWVELVPIGPILTLPSWHSSRALHLVTQQGEILFSSSKPETPPGVATFDVAAIDKLFAREGTVVEFTGFGGATVLGALRQVPDTGWGVVAHLDQAQAYATVVERRNFSLALILGVALAIGLAAYVLCLTIVGPLARLTQGATTVAEGNLDVRIPVHGSSEVSYTTEVFNQMVARLRQHRDERKAVTESLRERNSELHELSITDGLTGLYNRAYLPQVLDRELARAKRHRRVFSILMIDLDHFKWLNDTYGHLEGDAVLQGVAEIFKNAVRTADFAARYGGEEFLILLTETGPDGAIRFAERLRQKIEGMPSLGEKAVTASIGVASFPAHGNSVEAVIREADNALYRCKQNGRNRVALAALAEVEETAPTG